MLLVAVDPTREGHEQHRQGIDIRRHGSMLPCLIPARGPGTGSASGPVAGPNGKVLSNEPDWQLEGKDDKLVIRSAASPRDRALSVEEITRFVDGVFRIAESFGARFTSSSARSFSTATPR